MCRRALQVPQCSAAAGSHGRRRAPGGAHLVCLTQLPPSIHTQGARVLPFFPPGLPAPALPCHPQVAHRVPGRAALQHHPGHPPHRLCVGRQDSTAPSMHAAVALVTAPPVRHLLLLPPPLLLLHMRARLSRVTALFRMPPYSCPCPSLQAARTLRCTTPAPWWSTPRPRSTKRWAPTWAVSRCTWLHRTKREAKWRPWAWMKQASDAGWRRARPLPTTRVLCLVQPAAAGRSSHWSAPKPCWMKCWAPTWAARCCQAGWAAGCAAARHMAHC